MSVQKAVVKTLDGKETTVAEQAPVPCFRCGICCARYQPPLTNDDIDRIASAMEISRLKCIAKYAVKVPIKEGYLLRHAKEGCVFLAWDADRRARCTVYRARPKACREWTPSLAKPECTEGLARIKSKGRIVVPKELFSSSEERREFRQSLEKVHPKP